VKRLNCLHFSNGEFFSLVSGECHVRPIQQVLFNSISLLYTHYSLRRGKRHFSPGTGPTTTSKSQGFHIFARGGCVPFPRTDRGCRRPEMRFSFRGSCLVFRAIGGSLRVGGALLRNWGSEGRGTTVQSCADLFAIIPVTVAEQKKRLLKSFFFKQLSVSKFP
jgi:hypothetical protein